MLRRGSAGLLGLVARPGEQALGLDVIDNGIAAAVTDRTKRIAR